MRIILFVVCFSFFAGCAFSGNVKDILTGNMQGSGVTGVRLHWGMSQKDVLDRLGVNIKIVRQNSNELIIEDPETPPLLIKYWFKDGKLYSHQTITRKEIDK